MKAYLIITTLHIVGNKTTVLYSIKTYITLLLNQFIQDSKTVIPTGLTLLHFN